MNKIKKTSLYIIGIASLVCSFNFTQIKAMKNTKIIEDLEKIEENKYKYQETINNNQTKKENSNNDDENIDKIIENDYEYQENINNSQTKKQNDEENINKIIEDDPNIAMKNTKIIEDLEKIEENKYKYQETINNNQTTQENDDKDVNKIIEDNTIKTTKNPEITENLENTPNINNCQTKKENSNNDDENIDKIIEDDPNIAMKNTKIIEDLEKIEENKYKYQETINNNQTTQENDNKDVNKIIEENPKSPENDDEDINEIRENLLKYYEIDDIDNIDLIYALGKKILNIKEQIENTLSDLDSFGFNKFISSIEGTYKTIPAEIINNNIDSEMVYRIYDYLCLYPRFQNLKDKEFYKKIYHNYIKNYCKEFIEDKDFIKTYSKDFEENKNTIASENEEINKKNYELYKEKIKIINLQNKNEEIKSKIEILEKEITFTILDAVIKGYIEYIEKESEKKLKTKIEEIEKKINNEMTYKTMEKINEIPLKSMNPAKDIEEEIEKNSKEYSEICSEKYSEIFDIMVKKCKKKIKKYIKFKNILKKIINNNSENQIKTKLKYENEVFAKFLEENIGIKNIRKFNYKLENIPDEIIKENKKDIAIINKNIAIINERLSKIKKITWITSNSERSRISRFAPYLFELLFDEKSNILKNLIRKNNKDFIRYVFGEKILQEEKQK